MLPRIFFVLPLFFLCVKTSLAQEFKNIIAEFEGDKMKITYDLLCDDPEQAFSLSVFSSHNDYQTKLSNVTGDVGNNILPGRGKTITWYLMTELPVNFDETIQLKLIASPGGVITESARKSMKFIYPGVNIKAKTGKPLHIRWEGTESDNSYQLELYTGNTKKTDITGNVTNQNYTWKIPKKTTKAKNYRLKLTNRENSMDFIFSPEFEIKSGFPTALIAVPVIIVAGVTYVVLGSGGDEGGNGGNGGNTELSDLPLPVDPK